MFPPKRDVKKHAKARQRRRLKAQERLARDRLQAQQAAEALEQAFHCPSWVWAYIENNQGFIPNYGERYH